VLVDWEYCGIGDPVFDLAGLASHLGLDAAQRAQLLEAYGSQGVGVRLADACWAYDYVQWLWYRVAVSRSVARNSTALVEAASAAERRLRQPVTSA
jgi:thiamine kinase-like enzyme